MTTGPEAPQPSRGKALLPWLLVLLIVALGAAGGVVLVNRGDGENVATESPTEAESNAAPPSGAGTIAAGGATIYPLQPGLTVGDYEGHKVVATDVPVESVVDGVGLWVGKTPRDRIFVLAREAPAVEPGAVISFRGVVRAHGSAFAEGVGVTREQGAQRLKALRGHVLARKVTVSGA